MIPVVRVGESFGGHRRTPQIPGDDVRDAGRFQRRRDHTANVSFLLRHKPTFTRGTCEDTMVLVEYPEYRRATTAGSTGGDRTQSISLAVHRATKSSRFLSARHCGARASKGAAATTWAHARNASGGRDDPRAVHVVENEANGGSGGRGVGGSGRLVAKPFVSAAEQASRHRRDAIIGRRKASSQPFEELPKPRAFFRQSATVTASHFASLESPTRVKLRWAQTAAPRQRRSSWDETGELLATTEGHVRMLTSHLSGRAGSVHYANGGGDNDNGAATTVPAVQFRKSFASHRRGMTRTPSGGRRVTSADSGRLKMAERYKRHQGAEEAVTQQTHRAWSRPRSGGSARVHTCHTQSGESRAVGNDDLTVIGSRRVGPRPATSPNSARTGAGSVGASTAAVAAVEKETSGAELVGSTEGQRTGSMLSSIDPSVLRAVRRGERLVAGGSGAGAGVGYIGLLNPAELCQEMVAALASLTRAKLALEQEAEKAWKNSSHGTRIEAGGVANSGGGEVGVAAAGGATSAVSMLRRQKGSRQRPGTPNVTAGPAVAVDEETLRESLRRELELVHSLLALFISGEDGTGVAVASRLVQPSSPTSLPVTQQQASREDVGHKVVAETEDIVVGPCGFRRPKYLTALHIPTDNVDAELEAIAKTAAMGALASATIIEETDFKLKREDQTSVLGRSLADDEKDDDNVEPTERAVIIVVDEDGDEGLLVAEDDDSDVDEAFDEPSAANIRSTNVFPVSPLKASDGNDDTAVASPRSSSPAHAHSLASASLTSPISPRREYLGPPDFALSAKNGARPKSQPRQCHRRCSIGATGALDCQEGMRVQERLLAECQSLGLELEVDFNAIIDDVLSTHPLGFVDWDRHFGSKEGCVHCPDGDVARGASPPFGQAHGRGGVSSSYRLCFPSALLGPPL